MMGIVGDSGVPVIAAPMAGGASTPELVASVNAAGGFGFLAAGYKTVQSMTEQIHRTRALTSRPFGVNVFVPGPDDTDPDELAAYQQRLAPEAEHHGIQLGEPHWSDDDYPAKLAALVDDPVPWVSFTFGCPGQSDIAALQGAGSSVAVTVTTPDEARTAVRAGADAGGHQGSFDAGERTLPLAELLPLVRAAVDVPLIAAGGITTAEGVRSVIDSGAVAAQLGTAFLRTPESGASATHKDALADPRFTTTEVTRAFSGRNARGLANRFLRAHSAAAPHAYPHVHYLTGPLRAAASRAGDTETLHLWAGTGYRAAVARPAGEIVAELSARM
ncbi:NAD(P)H-dependent flavin oxidoreductase [Haloactinospora alba]|nr:nitronate monooxygenase [Haloactinospora alba]